MGGEEREGQGDAGWLVHEYSLRVFRDRNGSLIDDYLRVKKQRFEHVLQNIGVTTCEDS
jgi:hypothetical protein